MGEGGGFSWGGVEGGGEKAYNCNWITIKIFKNVKITEKNRMKFFKANDVTKMKEYIEFSKILSDLEFWSFAGLNDKNY